MNAAGVWQPRDRRSLFNPEVKKIFQMFFDHKVLPGGAQAGSSMSPWLYHLWTDQRGSGQHFEDMVSHGVFHRHHLIYIWRQDFYIETNDGKECYTQTPIKTPEDWCHSYTDEQNLRWSNIWNVGKHNFRVASFVFAQTDKLSTPSHSV